MCRWRAKRRTGFDKIPPLVGVRLPPGEDRTMGEIFRNRQWRVTDHGLERVDGRYDIEAGRLTETTIDGTIYDWPFRMAENAWLDYPAFVEAFAKALTIHKPRCGAADPEMLALGVLIGAKRNLASKAGSALPVRPAVAAPHQLRDPASIPGHGTPAAPR